MTGNSEQRTGDSHPCLMLRAPFRLSAVTCGLLALMPEVA